MNEAPHEPAPPAVAPAAPKPSAAADFKTAGEAASAILKALLLLLAIIAVGFVAATAVWRDQRTRHLAIELDVETEKSLRALGSDTDLRQLFVDALNERVHGVQQIVALNFAQLIDTSPAGDVSFKPFGLDVTSGQLAGIVRELIGSEPPLAARIEVMCSPSPCVAGAGEASLLFTLSGNRGGLRRAFPLRSGSVGLRRSLRAAMQQSAELLLEREEPMIASVYFLNVAQRRAFGDDFRADLERAAGAALKLRDANGQADCVANLVMGASLLLRGSWEDGLALEQRAVDSGDAVCKIHGATNVVFLLNSAAMCGPTPAWRDRAAKTSRQALDSLGRHSLGRAGALADERIPAAELSLQFIEALRRPAHDAARQAICLGQRNAGGGDSAALVADAERLLGQLADKLPPKRANAVPTNERELLAAMVNLAEFGLPLQDVVARYTAAQATKARIDAYLPGDAHPRKLFLLRGQLAMIAARAAQDTLFLEPQARRAALTAVGVDPVDAAGSGADALLRQTLADQLNDARVNFENALVSSPSDLVSDTDFDVKVLTLLGDALFVSGNRPAALDTYARAIAAFVAADAPVDQIAPLASALAHRALLMKTSGACSDTEAGNARGPQAPRPAAAPDPGCAANPGGDAALWPEVVEVLEPLIASGTTACAALELPPVLARQPLESASRQAFALLDCLRRHGPDNPAQLFAFRSQPSRGVHALLERATSARP